MTHSEFLHRQAARPVTGRSITYHMKNGNVFTERNTNDEDVAMATQYLKNAGDGWLRFVVKGGATIYILGNDIEWLSVTEAQVGDSMDHETQTASLKDR